MKKFTTDLRYANYICVLLKNGEKAFASKLPWRSKYNFQSEEIDRELNQQEYIDFIWEKGFTCDIAPKSGINVAPAQASQWTNEPSEIIEIRHGRGFHTQPSIITSGSIGKYSPKGVPVELYNFQLVVPTPTEFWHYGFKK